MAGIQELGRGIEDLTRTPASDALFFSEQERRVLELWDQEQELRLEINLLKAQRDGLFFQHCMKRDALADVEMQHHTLQILRTSQTKK